MSVGLQQTRDELGGEDVTNYIIKKFSERYSISGTVKVEERRMSFVLIPENPIYGEVGGADGADIVTIPVTMPLEGDQTPGFPVGSFCILDSVRWGVIGDCIVGDRDIDQYELTLLGTYTL